MTCYTVEVNDGNIANGTLLRFDHDENCQERSDFIAYWQNPGIRDYFTLNSSALITEAHAPEQQEFAFNVNVSVWVNILASNPITGQRDVHAAVQRFINDLNDIGDASSDPHIDIVPD